MKHDLVIEPVNDNLQGALIPDDKVDMVLTTLRNQLDYLYDTIPNAFAEWNEENCIEEKDDVETLYTELTLKKDLYSLLKFENAIMILQTKAFECDLCSPISEETAKGVRKYTRADYLEIGFTEKQLDDVIKRLSK